MPMKITNLPLFFASITFIFFTSIINQSSSRSINNQTPNPNHHQYYRNDPKITFIMQNVLNVTHHSPKPSTTKVTSPIPFKKPLGLFPPDEGIPLPESNPNVPALSTRTFGFSGVSGALQELEYGSVNEIDEHLFEGTIYGKLLIGKAKGIFVGSSEDGNSHMVALTANFGRGELKDGLKLFGVYNKDLAESHIAVIGGIGKFEGANGYAVIKSIGEENKIKKILSFNVYLS